MDNPSGFRKFEAVFDRNWPATTETLMAEVISRMESRENLSIQSNSYCHKTSFNTSLPRHGIPNQSPTHQS